MFKTPIFKGSCTAIVTPFNENGIDYDKMAELIDFQYDNGTSAIVVCGTTGENATMSRYEHEELIEFTCRHNDGRMKIIAGIGSNDTAKALGFGALRSALRRRRCAHGDAILQQSNASRLDKAFYICCRQS